MVRAIRPRPVLGRPSLRPVWLLVERDREQTGAGGGCVPERTEGGYIFMTRPEVEQLLSSRPTRAELCAILGMTEDGLTKWLARRKLEGFIIAPVGSSNKYRYELLWYNGQN